MHLRTLNAHITPNTLGMVDFPHGPLLEHNRPPTTWKHAKVSPEAGALQDEACPKF